MATLFHSIDSSFTIAEKRALKAWIAFACNHFEKKPGDINIILCSDDYLLKMNREHLNHDYYTDIITFEYSSNPVSGDLYISSDRVSENAQNQCVSIENEMHRVIIHGVLHILGFKDKSSKDADKMRSMEDYFLSKITNFIK